MDRKALFEQALKETDSLVEAVKLVKEIESFIGFSPPVVNIPLVEPRLESNLGIPKINPCAPATMVFPVVIKRKGKGGYKTKRWTPSEINIAETMFNAGKSFEQVAAATERSIKSLRNALSSKVIKPTLDPRSETRRAASLKGHITFGRKLSNYEEAQALIDTSDQKKKV
jgi:hypothetical protein